VAESAVKLGSYPISDQVK